MLNDKIGGQGRQGRSGPAATEPRGTAEAAAVVVVEKGVLDVGVPAAGEERVSKFEFPALHMAHIPSPPLCVDQVPHGAHREGRGLLAGHPAPDDVGLVAPAGSVHGLD